MNEILIARIKQALESPARILLSYGDTLELARIALASLEASSRKLFTCSACGAEGLDEPLESKCHCNEDGAHWIESVVYTAPPAPVSVPDEYVAAVSTPTNLGYEAGWNACRAAMLQEVK